VDNLCTRMREVQRQAFAVQELKLFLDTHPDCTEAMTALSAACEKLGAARAAYNELAPLAPCAAAGNPGWTWGCMPWPWEGEV